MSQLNADEKIAEELSRHGLRATRQRIAALRLLRRLKSHPTSAELHARLQSPMVSEIIAQPDWHHLMELRSVSAMSPWP